MWVRSLMLLGGVEGLVEVGLDLSVGILVRLVGHHAADAGEDDREDGEEDSGEKAKQDLKHGVPICSRGSISVKVFLARTEP